MKTKKDQYKYLLYLNAFNDTAKEYANSQSQDIKPFVKKLIFYGIKTVITKPKSKTITYEETISNFQFVSIIKDLIATLTPEEFVNLFPIAKEFKGHKWEMKDYFYTRDYIKTLESNKPIGANALEFIWEYTNWEITEFNMISMNCLSNLREFDGHPSIIEEWVDMNNIKTCTLHKDQNGLEYLFDKETGKATRLKKKLPRHMKIIK